MENHYKWCRFWTGKFDGCNCHWSIWKRMRVYIKTKKILFIS